MKAVDLLILVPRMMMLKNQFLSVGTLELASYIAPKGYDVKVIDDNAMYKKYSNSELLETIHSYHPKIIGISINVLNAYGSYELLKQIRQHFPHKIIIAGGLHTYASADEIITYDFDVVAARGETFVSGRDVDTAPRWQGSAELRFDPSDRFSAALQVVGAERYPLQGRREPA